MSFADVLVALRLRRGLTQAGLAEATGVSERTISNLERGSSRPRRATARALAEGLRLHPDEREVFELALHQPARDPVVDQRRQVCTLPAPVGPVIGRAAEVRELARLVSRAPQRVVTIVGPGGVGKSRVALEVAWLLADQFDWVGAVDVSTLRDRDEVLAALAAAAGRPVPGPVTPSTIADAAGDTRWLLLLDSIEQVPDAGDDVAELVRRCANVRLLATGRAAWARPVAVVRPLAPLALPDLDAEDERTRLDHAVPRVRANPSVALLVERTRAVRPDFTVSAANVAAVVALCRRLDGLPLAIELAAGQLRERDVAEVAAELAERSTGLRADVVDMPGRHRTLRATVDWTADRLSQPDRLVLSALGAFRGRIDRAALAAVLRAMGSPEPESSLARLAGASLITLVDGDSGAVDMLDTIREVAADLLAESGVEATGRTAHARHLLDLVRGGDHAAIDGQVDDVRSAVAFAVAPPAGAASLLDTVVVTALADYLGARGRFAEAYRVLRKVAEGNVGADVAAVALLRAGIAVNQFGDHRAALECAQSALTRAETSGGTQLRPAALNLVGSVYKSLGDLGQSAAAFRSCLAAAEATGNTRYVTVALNNLGTVAHDRGAYDEALVYYGRSLEIKRGLDDRRGIATALTNLGGVHRDLGDDDRAHGYLVEAVAGFREVGEPHALAFALALLAASLLARSEAQSAATAAAEAARIGAQIEHGPVRAMAEQALGDVARHRGDTADAILRYEAALACGPEPYERTRLLDRLAATVVDSDPDRAADVLAEADAIRQARRYTVPPADRSLVETTRRRVATGSGA